MWELVLFGAVVAVWAVAFTEGFTEGPVRGKTELIFFAEERGEGEFIWTRRLNRGLRKFVGRNGRARSCCSHFSGEEKRRLTRM